MSEINFDRIKRQRLNRPKVYSGLHGILIVIMELIWSVGYASIHRRAPVVKSSWAYTHRSSSVANQVHNALLSQIVYMELFYLICE